MKAKQKTPKMLCNCFSALSVSLILCLVFVSVPRTGQAEERFEFQSYKDIMQLFEKLDYTEQSWNHGSREVARVYLATIPELWRAKHARQMETRTKKEIFFRILAPLILKANENIAAERKQLLKSAMQPDTDQQWLRELAIKYRVSQELDTEITQQELEQLQIRVDILPPSLIMAQAAEKSGLGTSRFANPDNAMFSQWSRSGKEKDTIAAIDTPLHTVEAYMLKLNTRQPYTTLRAKRAALKESGKNATGLKLLETLAKLPGQAPEYVASLKGLIIYNRLTEIDQAYLRDMEPILLVPVGAGSQ